MTGNININVTGSGNASFGSVSQGNGNTVSTATTGASQSIVSHYGAARDEITRRAGEAQCSAAERDAALAHLETLKTKAADAAAKPEEGAGILAAIRQNYAWAYPVFKDFVKVAWPVVLTLVGL